MAKKDIVTPEELIEAQDARSVISKEMNDDRDLVNQLLGQAQLAGASEEFFRTVRTSKLSFVKENQLYKSLKGKKTPHGAEILKGTWEEFCKLLGRSVDQVDRDIANLKTFGEEALESMSRMGIGYRELRQFRKLPEDEKQALIEVAKEGDKEGFAEVAETIIAKHAKEKESLIKQLADSNASLEASRTTAEKEAKRVIAANNELEKLKKHIKDMSPAEIGEHIRNEVAHHAVIVEQDIKSFRHALQELTEHGYKHGIDHTPFISGVIGQVSLTLNQVKLEFKIDDTVVDDNPIPKWQRPEALAEAEAAIAALPAIGEE